MTNEFVYRCLQMTALIVVDAGLKAVLLLTIAGLICLALRYASAALRHQIWSLAFCGLLFLPLLSSVIPQWRIPLLTTREIPNQSPLPIAIDAAASEPRSDAAAIAADDDLLQFRERPLIDAMDGRVLEDQVRALDPLANEGGKKSAQINSISMVAPALNRTDLTESGFMVLDWMNVTRRATLIAILWLTGFVMVMFPFGVGVVVSRRFVRAARRMTEEQATQLIESPAGRLGLARRIIVIETTDSIAPMTTGVFQPFVILPLDWRNWSAERLRFVLLHELAHVRRLDVLFQMIGRVACGLYWFNPLAWYALRRLRIERELACDDCVVTVGETPSDYARQLLEIARAYRSPRLAIGISITRISGLEERILSLLDGVRSHRPVSRSLAVRLAVSASALVTSLSLVTLAQPIPGEPVSATTEQVVTTAVQDDVAAPNAVGKLKEDKSNQAPVPDPILTTEPVAKPAKREQGLAQVHVVGANGKPVEGAEIYWFRTRVNDLRPMKPQLVATTDKAGNARFQNPMTDAVDKNEPASWDFRESIVVKAKGHGFVVTSPAQLNTTTSPFGTLAKALGGTQQANVKLPAVGDSIRGRLVDIDGRPVVGATLRIRYFVEENNWMVAHFAKEDDGGDGSEWRARARSLLDVIEPEQLRHVLPMATTDADGRFEIRDIGEKRVVQLLVQGDQIESTEVIAWNGSDDEIVVPSGRLSTENKLLTIYGRNLLRAIGPSKPVEGRVVDLDTGDPIADAVVRAFSIHGKNLNGSREREEYATRTDKEGHFRIAGLPLGNGNRLAAFTTGDVAYIPIGGQVDTTENEPTIRRDFRLKRGVWAEGRVFDAETNEPFTGQISYYYFRNQELESAIPGIREAFVDGLYSTTVNGEFRVPVLPSRGILAFSYEAINPYPSGDDTEKINRYPKGDGADTIKGAENFGGLPSFPTLPSYLIARNYTRIVEVLPVDGKESIRVDMPLYASQPVSVSVIDSQGKPVTGYDAYGAAVNWGWQQKKAADFDVGDLKQNEERKVFVFHRARNIAGAVIVKQDAERPVQVELKAAGSIAGRLVDQDGEPITDASLFTNYEKLRDQKDAAIWANHPTKTANPTTIPVDKHGRFLVDGLIPGWKYSAYASASRSMQGQTMDRVIGTPFENVSIEPGEEKDLGDVVLKSKE